MLTETDKARDPLMDDTQDHTAPAAGAPAVQASPRVVRQAGQPRVVTHPHEVAQLVLRQIETVHNTKDELTLALRGLTDLTKQLARAYAAHTQTIAALQARVKALEAQVGQCAPRVGGDGSSVPSQD